MLQGASNAQTVQKATSLASATATRLHVEHSRLQGLKYRIDVMNRYIISENCAVGRVEQSLGGMCLHR